MKKITRLILQFVAIAIRGNSLKRLAFLFLGIILSFSTVSATQYCQQSITAGGKTVLVSLTKPSTNVYEVLIESNDVMTGLFGNIWANNVNGAQAELSSTGVVSNGGKTITMTINSTTVPSFYTSLYVLYPGLITFPWPASITWGQCVAAGIPTLATTTAATDITTTSATSGGNVTVEGNSAVTARGVCWGTATAPTVALATKTVDGAGAGSFTSSITGLSSGVKYYVRSYATNTEGTSYGAEVSFTTLDTEIPTAFTATKGAVGATTVELLLNATDNSGSIAYTISYGAGPTVFSTTGTSGVQKSYIVTGLTESTAYTFSIVAKDAALNAATNNPIEVTATTTATVPVIAAPTPPVRIATDVVSIFSDAYSPAAGTRNYNPNWGQSGSASIIQVATDNTLKYTNLNYQGTIIGSNVNASAMTYLHVDIWSANETSLQFYLISTTAPSEKFIQLTPLLQNAWNSYNIPLTSYTSQAGFSVASLKELKVVGSGGKIVCLDNIYFYKDAAIVGDVTAPTSFTATKGAVTDTSVELLLNATDESGTISYTVTYGATTLNTTGASAVQKSYIVTGLSPSTAYSFSVVAKDASNNAAANNPISVSATTIAAIPTTPPTAAPTPTKDAAKVISIFSNAYTDVVGTQFNPNWGQSTVVTTEQIESNATLKYANLNYQGTQYTTTNAFAMTHLHVDVWTANETTLQVTPISPGKELLVTLTPLTQGVWNSYDILLSSFTNVDLANLFQFKFVGSGGKTVYLDNIYFYNNNVDVDATAPAAFTATKGAVTYNTVELLLNATDNSGAVAYDITYGGTTVSTSSASGVQKSYTVTGLSASTTYSFSVVAKDATGNAAAAIVIPATTSAALSSPVTAAPTPSIDGANVVSIFSDAYTNVAGINYNPGWGQSTVYSQISVGGSSIIKLENFGYQGTTFNNINASAMTHLHLDVFTPNETSLQVTPISPGHELLVSVGALTLDTWNSIIIPLSSFTGVVFSDLFQFKFVGSGGKIVYLDNIYLYNQTATSISENETNSKVSCYPNPVVNKTTIRSISEMSQVIVRNLLGQTVKSEILNTNQKTIDLSSISAGNYFVTVKLANGQSTTQKIVKL